MTQPERRFLWATALANRLSRSARLYVTNRSLRAWGMLASHAWRRLFSRSVPVFIDIALTYRCQCRCVHCSAEALRVDRDEELDTEQFKSVIQQARELGVLEVIFSGGEPLLREDILELVEYTHRLGLLIRLNTNGLLLDRALVSELKKAGVTQCAVSIDDSDAATHDQLRRLPGLHAKALAGIRALREFGIPCQLLTYASKGNVTEGLEKIIEEARALGVLAVFIFFPIAVGRWDEAWDETLTADERARVRALQDVGLVHLELPTARTMCCACDRLVMHVTANGNVTPCPFVPYALGNVTREPLRRLWQRHSEALKLEFRGDCPMNHAGAREAFRRHAQAVAAFEGAPAVQ